MPRFRILAAIMLSFSTSIINVRGQDATPLPVDILPDNPALLYDGRFAPPGNPIGYDKNPALACEWPASSVTLRFTGAALNAYLNDEGHNYWQVFIDGASTGKLALRRGPALYAVAHGLAPGEHIVKLIKATEAFGGATAILGFQLDAGAKLLPVEPPKRRIEIIGDSISCGYGVEATGPQPFTLITENATLAYGCLAAERLHAGYTCIAWSGRKMWPDDTIPEIYDRTFPRRDTPPWDFKINIPDAVIINLGTNDFGGPATPDEGPWIEAYRKFIARVRKNYPDAVIYCATGPMLDDGNNPRKPKSTLLDYVQKIVTAEHAAGDEKIHALDFGEQDPQNGFGANYHPSRKTQLLMAAQLVETLRHDLGWR